MRTGTLASVGLALTLVVGCSSKNNNNNNATGGTGATGGSSTGGSGGSGASGGSGGAAGSGTGGNAGASGGAAGAGATGGAAGSGGSTGITSCTDGVLFSGDPYFDGNLSGWNPAGQDKFADPPLRARHLAVSGQVVFYDTNYEVWRTDNSNVVRVAGDENEPNTQYMPSGTCAASRFINIQGIATLPSGNVIVDDERGGGLVELQTPTGTCTAAPYAGNTATIQDADITGDVANQGDTNGPGANAKFYGVRLATSDEQGNVFVDDSGNSKIKMIANDSAHTVSTLYDYASADGYLVLAMTAFKGKLYVSAGTIVSDYLWAIDIANPGTPQVLYSGVGHYPELSNETATINGMTNDGQSLIVSSSKGYIWLLGTDGSVKSTLAGMGLIVDFPTGLDFKTPIPAAQLPLKGLGVNDGTMAMLGNHPLWAGAGGNGVGMYVLQLDCQ